MTYFDSNEFDALVHTYARRWVNGESMLSNLCLGVLAPGEPSAADADAEPKQSADSAVDSSSSDVKTELTGVLTPEQQYDRNAAVKAQQAQSSDMGPPPARLPAAWP